MRIALAMTLVALAGLPARAQDAAKPAESANPAPAPAKKKERTTSPQAEAALKRYAGLLHFPSAKHKTLQMKTYCEVETLGGEVGCKFTAGANGDLALEVELPEAVMRNLPPEQVAMTKGMIAGKVSQYFKPLLVPADVMARQYDLAARVEKDVTIVEFKRFDEKAAWERLTLTFDKDGLLRRQVGTLNVDPNDLVAAMDAGAEIEVTLDHKKRGDLYTIEGGRIVKPIGDSTMKIDYYAIEGQAPLPKTLEFVDPLLGEVPIVISVHDYVVNGEPVPETARKKQEKKPAAPSPPEKKPEDAQKPGAPK